MDRFGVVFRASPVSVSKCETICYYGAVQYMHWFPCVLKTQGFQNMPQELPRVPRGLLRYYFAY